MSQYHIYQTDAEYRFWWWDDTKNIFSLNDYHKVYSGELFDSVSYKNETTEINQDDIAVLEMLYREFNIKHPEDYRARSMSVSDVVAIVRKDKTKYYYCDNMGWKLIKEVDNHDDDI
jgi:hypothetical protein